MATRRQLFQGMLGGTGAVIATTLVDRKFAFAQGRSKALRVAWPYDTSSLDAVGVGVQRSTWAVSLHVYDRLVSYALDEQPDGTRQYNPKRLAPELAESWTLSADKKVITFNLRKNATFHDGSPVTAEDVQWSIARSISVPAAAGVMRIGGITKPDQMKVLDQHTLQVTLAEPNRYAISVFTIPFAAIINAKLAKLNATAQDPWANEWLRRNAAGGGAFRVESFRNDQVVLTRNDNWVSGVKPAVESIIFQTVPEASTRAALVERNSADVAFEIPPADFSAVASRGAAKAVAIPMLNQMDFVAFNSKASPFSDVRVRQAVAHALPYAPIFESVFRGRGRGLYGGGAAPVPGVFPQPHDFAYDPEKSKQLLQQAGLGSGFDTSLSYSQSKAGYFDPLSLAIRDALGKVGIRVSIDRLPGAQFDERLLARSMPMMLENRIAWLSLPDYWMRAFYTGTSTSNLGNFDNPQLAAMLAELPVDISEEEYGKRTADMIKLVLSEIPLLPIRQGAFEVVVAKDVAGLTYWFHGLPDGRNIRRA